MSVRRWSGGGGGASLENAKRWQKDSPHRTADDDVWRHSSPHVRQIALANERSRIEAYKPTASGSAVVIGSIEAMERQTFESADERVNEEWGEIITKITVWHKGGGHKRLYRVIDFKRDLFGVNGVIRRIEYDPNRTTRIALVDYPDGIKPRYILAPDGAKAGDVISSRGGQPADGRDPSSAIDVRPGNAMPLSEMPIGTIVHNVELVPGRGGAFSALRRCLSHVG